LAKKKASPTLKESCGKCGGDEFSISDDAKHLRYCAVCNNVWGPMSEADIRVLAAQRDNAMLKDENAQLKKRVSSLEADILGQG